MEAPRQMEARQQLMSIQELSEELEAAKNSLQEKESQLYGAWNASCKFCDAKIKSNHASKRGRKRVARIRSDTDLG